MRESIVLRIPCALECEESRELGSLCALACASLASRRDCATCSCSRARSRSRRARMAEAAVAMTSTPRPAATARSRACAAPGGAQLGLLGGPAGREELALEPSEVLSPGPSAVAASRAPR